MAVVVGVVSQKGGVGKSTLARAIAREYAASGWDVLLADLDTAQATSVNWSVRRADQQVEPQVSVQGFKTVASALRHADKYDLIVFDGRPHASAQTREVAEAAALVIIPTGTALDDLEPSVLLANDLLAAGQPKEKIGFVLSRVGSSEAENNEARDYLAQTGYALFDGEIRERTAYRRASDTGRSLRETSHPSVNEKADVVLQSIIDRITERTR